MQGRPNRVPSQGELKVHIHDCWSGHTSRASLHRFPCHFADMSAKTSMPKQARSTPTLDKM